MAPQIVLDMVRSVPVEPTDHHDGSPCSPLSLPRVAFGGESISVHQQHERQQQHPQLHQASKSGRTACWQHQRQQQQQQQQQAAAEAKVEAESEAKGGYGGRCGASGGEAGWISARSAIVVRDAQTTVLGA